jgi:glutathione S-transferase
MDSPALQTDFGLVRPHTPEWRIFYDTVQHTDPCSVAARERIERGQTALLHHMRAERLPRGRALALADSLALLFRRWTAEDGDDWDELRAWMRRASMEVERTVN